MGLVYSSFQTTTPLKYMRYVLTPIAEIEKYIVYNKSIIPYPI